MDDLTSSSRYGNSERYNGFWPLVFIALSFITILIWQLIIGIQARGNGQRLQEQQVKMVDASHQIQTGLEKLVRDLVEISKNDDDAKAIVAKYGISINAPAGSAVNASPGPTANPAP